MGTGPRGGRRVREAAEAAKAAEASAPAPASAADVAAAPPPAKRPKGDAAPPPKVGASVDPEDVDRKAALVLAKRGFAEAAVARFMARAPSASEDASRSFNEQKRLRVAAATAWLLAHAELWELPDAARAEASAARAGASDAARDDDTPTARLDAARGPDDAAAPLSERAETLIAKGLLPIAEAHLLPPRAGTRDPPTPPIATTAGAGAQDRERTGASLRQRKLEKAAARRADLCAAVARGRECPRGDACERSHDLDGFLRGKPKDIPGACPFEARRTGGEGVDGAGDAAAECPYGVRCRFAGAHASRLVGPGRLPAGGGGALGSPPRASPSSLGDGSVPSATLGIPGATYASPVPELNVLSDAKQRALATNALAFPRSDAILAETGAPLRCLSKTQAARARARAGTVDSSASAFDASEPRACKPSLDLRGKLYVAPLTTVGNMPFRRVCVGMGADVTVSEMAMASKLLKGDRSEWALVRRHPSERVFGAQVCGGWPDLMARCGELLDREASFDFVDVNMGCPIDGVCAKGAGSALLRDAESVARMEAVTRAASRSMRRTPLTIKIRMGFTDDPTRYVAWDVVRNARSWGAAAVTLHGRTRAQRYSRLADWGYIQKCADAAESGGVQLVGNGDVFDWRDYERRMSACGGNLATCMIGRGALVKPWLMTEIKERRHWDISATERLDVFRDFARFGLEHWGSDARGVETTRRFMLEWMSYTHRYVPVGLLESGVAQAMHLRPAPYRGRNDLESLLASDETEDWMRVAAMFLGPAGENFRFVPKHRSNSYSGESAEALRAMAGGGEEEEPQNG